MLGSMATRFFGWPDTSARTCEKPKEEYMVASARWASLFYRTRRQRMLTGTRRAILPIVFLLLPFALLGCRYTYKPHYSLADVPSRPSPRHPIRVAIAPFGQGFKQGKKEGNIDFTRAAAFAIARHFNHVRLFAVQMVVSQELGRPDPETLAKLRGLNYDALLIGDLHDINATDSYKPPQGAVGFIGAVVPLVAVIADVSQERALRGFVELSDIRLIDTSSGRVMWTGSVTGSYQRKGAFIGGFMGLDGAFKDAVQKLAEQLDTISPR